MNNLSRSIDRSRPEVGLSMMDVHTDPRLLSEYLVDKFGHNIQSLAQ